MFPKPIMQLAKRPFQSPGSLKGEEDVVNCYTAHIIGWFSPLPPAAIKEMKFERFFKEYVKRMKVAVDLA
jgi:hypothetical protein